MPTTQPIMIICRVVDRLSHTKLSGQSIVIRCANSQAKGKHFLRNVATHHGLADVRCGTNVTQSGVTMKYFLREILMAAWLSYSNDAP